MARKRAKGWVSAAPVGASLSNQVSEPAPEYCLSCEAWKAADHKCQNANSDARALAEFDSDDHG